MSPNQSIFSTPGRRIASLAAFVFILDQFTKLLVLRFLVENYEHTVISGFFSLTRRANTGAAWSLFAGNNAVLAIVALIALAALILNRHHFNAHTAAGQVALGLIFGGITGNLTDRLLPGRHAVVDFLHFYLQRRGSYDTLDFPAFNIADSAICTGVALIFFATWRNEQTQKSVAS